MDECKTVGFYKHKHNNYASVWCSFTEHQHLLSRPYLKNRLLDPIAYPVSGVDMPGHFCEFIGPRWWLPFGPGPLARRRILNCLLQFRCGVRGPKTRVVCARGDWCSVRCAAVVKMQRERSPLEHHELLYSCSTEVIRNYVLSSVGKIPKM